MWYMMEEKKHIWGKVMMGGLYALYGASCLFLYYKMCQPPEGMYHSDLPAHIASGVEERGYSFLEILYKYLCHAGIGSKAIPLLLMCLTLAAIYLSYRLITQMYPKGNAVAMHLLAFAANLEMPLYLSFIHPKRNMGLQTGSMWHNDTYLGMRVFGLLVLLLYFKHQETYKESFKGKQWIGFAAALFMANFMKPNFLLSFAPVMGILLLRDLIQSRGKEIKAIFWFGLAVIPSLFILIFQSVRLFGEGTGGGSIGFSVAYILCLRNEHPICSLLQSAAFPLAVLLLHAKDLVRDRIYGTSWLIWLFGLLEFLFLNQTGACINDGNLTWGYSFCLTLIFTVSAAKLYQKWQERRTEDRKYTAYDAGLFVCAALLLWHVVDGMIFYGGLLQGLPYAR